MTPIRIVIADDHPAYRDGLAMQLSDRPDVELVGLACDGDEAVELIAKLKPDVAIVDLVLPRMDGIEVVERAAALGSATKIAIVSAFQDSQTVYRAFEAGAAAYLLKVASAAEVHTAILAVAAGESVIPPDLQRGLAEEIRRHNTKGPESVSLTSRELEILRLTADGKQIREIASELFIGVTTVKTHLQRAYEKLAVSDRAAAIAAAMRKGLLK